jgi:hypothetical protein
MPRTITSWVPGVEGTYGTTSDPSDTLNTIGFGNGNCADAYIGGKFTSVNGTTVQNIAEISTTTGNVVSTFASKASGADYPRRGQLLAGGAAFSLFAERSITGFLKLNSPFQSPLSRNDGTFPLSILRRKCVLAGSMRCWRVWNLSPVGLTT